MIKADMHVHTNASDGLFAPEEAVKHALSAGLKALAVTDHDTVFNTLKVNTLCKNSGIYGINGIEVSAYFGTVKVHTLGFGFDIENPQFTEFLNSLCSGSVKRAEDVIKKLNSCGVKLTVEEAAAERSTPQIPVHTMHICRAAAKKGYALNPYDFYKRYLIAGKPAFSNICRPTPEQAIEAINCAGGIAVLAHPGRIELNKCDLRALICSLTATGLQGIEAVYSTHTAEETAYFKELAEELNLLVTGGSDTHFYGGNRSIGVPEFFPSTALRQKLRF